MVIKKTCDAVSLVKITKEILVIPNALVTQIKSKKIDISGALVILLSL